MDLRDLLGRLHRNYTNPLLWIDPSKYNKPQASALGNRLLANLNASQINYVLVSLLIIIGITRPNTFGNIVLVATTVACFIVQNPYVYRERKLGAIITALILTIFTSSCQTPACLSWAILISAIVVGGHASFFDPSGLPVAHTSPPKPTSPPPAKPAEPATAKRKFISSSLSAPVITDALPLSKETPSTRKIDWNKRTNVVKEIESTEGTYLDGLQVLLEVFMKPFKAAAAEKDPCISAESIKTIFSDIEVIVLYSNTLREDIKLRLKDWDNERSKLGDIFLRFADFLKTYSSYIRNYSTGIATVTKCKANPDFAKLLAQCESDSRCRMSPLSSFLIMPIQRIPRYLLLLKELIKHTPESHPDFTNLNEAHDKIQKVANALNEAEREAESMHKIYLIQTSLEGDYDNLMEAHRRFVREGWLKFKSSKKADAEVYALLFNDCLVLSKVSKKSVKSRQSIETASKAGELTRLGAKLEFKKMFKLYQTKMSSGPDDKSFVLTQDEDAEGPVCFTCLDASEKKDWHSSIDAAISDSTTKLHFFQDMMVRQESKRGFK